MSAIRSTWIVRSAVPVVLAGALSCNAEGIGSAAPSAVSLQQSGMMTVEGELRCLPHRSGYPSTFECAIGLRDSDGRYYALQNLKDDVRLNDRVRVTGRFTPGAKEPYDVVGTIEVESQVRLDRG